MRIQQSFFFFLPAAPGLSMVCGSGEGMGTVIVMIHRTVEVSPARTAATVGRA